MAVSVPEGPSTGTVVRIVLTIFGVSFLLYGAYLVRSVLVLVLIAAFLAVGLDPAVRRLQRLGLRRGLAVAVIFFGTLLFILGFITAVVPPLVDQITNFATNLPDYIQDLSQRNPTLAEWVEENDIAQRLQSAVNDVPNIIGSSFRDVLGVAGTVASAIFNGLTILVLTIYFLLSLQRIHEGSIRLIPKSRRARIAPLIDQVLEKIGGYIAGQITVALIAAILAFAFLTIAGVPFPVALALWVAIAALIPLVGATLGAVPAVVAAMFDSLTLGFVTLGFFLIYQQVENYIIHPRIMTRSVDISPAAVLLAALIGANLLGFVGALIAIPTAAAIKLIAQEIVVPRAEAG